MATRSMIEIEPAYTFVTARILLISLYNEAFATTATTRVSFSASAEQYRQYLPEFVRYGIATGLLDERLQNFDLTKIAAALRPERDLLFAYSGLQILYDRYLLQYQGRRFELPQLLWMRVAMGLALQEEQKEARAIEFYELISQFYFTPATPTL